MDTLLVLVATLGILAILVGLDRMNVSLLDVLEVKKPHDAAKTRLQCRCGCDLATTIAEGKSNCPGCGDHLQNIFEDATQAAARDDDPWCECQYNVCSPLFDQAGGVCPKCKRPTEMVKVERYKPDPEFRCRCGYNLAGSVKAGQTACPECGQSFLSPTGSAKV